eukprot:616388-Prymnesium_polylepis.1
MNAQRGQSPDGAATIDGLKRPISRSRAGWPRLAGPLMAGRVILTRTGGWPSRASTSGCSPRRNLVPPPGAKAVSYTHLTLPTICSV